MLRSVPGASDGVIIDKLLVIGSAGRFGAVARPFVASLPEDEVVRSNSHASVRTYWFAAAMAYGAMDMNLRLND